MVVRKFFMLFLIGCTGFFSGALAQSVGQIPLEQQNTLEQAIHFINSNKNDSALAHLQPVLEQLAASGLLDSPFGLKTQLVKGQALEQNHRHKEAIAIYNDIKGKCEATQQWDTYAGTCLAMARLYEKIYRPQRAKENLELARTAIGQHQLDSHYPSLLIRYAFWHQTFGGYPDSIRYYAEKAVEATNVSDDPHLDYSLLMLKAGLLDDKDNPAAIEYYKNASKIAKGLGDYVRLSDTWKAMTNLYGRNGRAIKTALTYNDSTIMACYQAIAEGNERIYTLGYAYRIRGQLFESIGKVDSALFYAKKGFAQELEFLEQRESDRVAEVDARYRDEQKSQKIADQADVIRSERRSSALLFLIFFITLLSAVGLYFSKARYKRALRKMEEQNNIIQQQSEQLKSLDAAKSRFFANISHELRTPLTLLLGPIKSLQNGKHSPEQQGKLLNIAKQSVKQLQQLVNEILDLQKLEMGKMEIQTEPTLLAAFFNRYATQFESLAQNKQIDYRLETSIAEDVVANIDREKCRQMLYNLLSNALKFTPTGGWVRASFSLQGKNLHISVADSGAGIPPYDLPHVFDRFFQSNRPERPAEGGTGIGLALCHEYAKLFGGTISVESPQGNGSVFSVVFPVTLADERYFTQGKAMPETVELDVNLQAAVSAKPSLTQINSANKPTILIVEDNPELQGYIRLILEEKYHVLTAGNGQEALDCQLPTANCQLIISDLMMPIMDGYQLLEKLKSNDATRHIPVIMLTARAEVKDRLKALRIGVDDYLTKPFEEEELLLRIDKLLQNQSVRRQEPEVEELALTISQPDQAWLLAFEEYVRNNIASPQLSVQTLASKFTMSESTLLRQLKRLTGLTPQKYLIEIRLNEARQLLENRQFDSVTKIAVEVGYPDVRSFSRAFKERFGKLPSETLID